MKSVLGGTRRVSKDYCTMGKYLLHLRRSKSCSDDAIILELVAFLILIGVLGHHGGGAAGSAAVSQL